MYTIALSHVLASFFVSVFQKKMTESNLSTKGEGLFHLTLSGKRVSVQKVLQGTQSRNLSRNHGGRLIVILLSSQLVLSRSLI